MNTLDDLETIKTWLIPERSLLVNVLRKIGLEEGIIKHSESVADISLKVADEMIAKGLKVDKKIVEAGALLHDIGLAKVCDHSSPEHSVIGGDIIRKIGLPDQVAMCAEVHEFHGGVTYKEAFELQYPIYPLRESYAPKTLEEKIVNISDLFIFVLIEGPEEYGFEKLDPWKDLKGAIEATALPYCQDVYEKKLGVSVDKNHPIIKRAYEINIDMLDFVKPSFF